MKSLWFLVWGLGFSLPKARKNIGANPKPQTPNHYICATINSYGKYTGSAECRQPDEARYR
jgi:hypothetical protein